MSIYNHFVQADGCSDNWAKTIKFNFHLQYMLFAISTQFTITYASVPQFTIYLTLVIHY